MTTVIILATITYISLTFATKTDNNQPPYMVALYYFLNNNPRICGGSLIKPDWILTSQNCKIENFGEEIEEDNLIALINVYDLNKLDESPAIIAKNWVSHPEFSKNNYSLTHDVALIQLESSFVHFNVYPIFLADDENVFLDEFCDFFYWESFGGGQKSRNITTTLKRSKIKLIPKEECKKLFKNRILLTFGQICGEFMEETPAALTGGPVTCQKIEFAFFSWKPKGKIGIFTRVDSFEKYISSVVPDLKILVERKPRKFIATRLNPSISLSNGRNFKATFLTQDFLFLTSVLLFNLW